MTTRIRTINLDTLQQTMMNQIPRYIVKKNLPLELITSTMDMDNDRHSRSLDTIQKTSRDQSMATILDQVRILILGLEEKDSGRNLNTSSKRTRSRTIKDLSFPNNIVNLNLRKNIYLVRTRTLKICIIIE